MPQEKKVLFGMTSTRQTVIPEGLKTLFGMTFTRQVVMPERRKTLFGMTRNIRGRPPFFSKLILYSHNVLLCI